MDGAASYGVYISQLIRFARVSSHVIDFNIRNKLLNAKLLNQGYRYHKLRTAFSKFYGRHSDIVSKFNVRLKSLLQQGLSEPESLGEERATLSAFRMFDRFVLVWICRFPLHS